MNSVKILIAKKIENRTVERETIDSTQVYKQH